MEKQVFVVLHTIQEGADLDINFDICESYATAKRLFDEQVADEKLNGLSPTCSTKTEFSKRVQQRI